MPPVDALKCAACGRRLRHPSPTGLGPVCARRLGATVSPPRKPARASPAATPPPLHPGQTELPIAVQLAL